MSWTIPHVLPSLSLSPVLTMLTIATVLASFYAIDIALDLIQLRRIRQAEEEEEELEDE